MTCEWHTDDIWVAKAFGAFRSYFATLFAAKSCYGLWNNFLLRVVLIHGFKYSVPFHKIHSCYRMGNNFEHLFILFKRYKAITVCWCKQLISNSFQTCLYSTYLFKLYCKSIMILPANDLTNICREIRKIRLILWMAHTCNMKGMEEVETLGRNKCTSLYIFDLCICTSLTLQFVGQCISLTKIMSDCSRSYQ